MKKKDSPQNNQNSGMNNYLKEISELNITNAEKIEILIKNKLNLKTDEISDDMHLYNEGFADELDIMELLMEVETVFKINIQEGSFRLTIGEFKNYVTKKLNNPDYIISEEKILYNDGWFGYENTLHRENLYGRSSAIKELVENRYIKDDGNPFKELINFILLYFANGTFISKEELLNIIQGHFPIMSTHLIRQLNLINQNLQLHTDFKNDTITDLDEQKGYDEFLDFVYKLFTQSFTDKKLRDKAIRSNFKIFGGDLISFIDTENEKKGAPRETALHKAWRYSKQ